MTQMEPMTQNKNNVTKYLVYGAISMLIINFLLLFLPFIEIYQPSCSERNIFGTVYKDWYTDSTSMAVFIFPLILTGIPYICSTLSLSMSLRGKANLSGFVKIMNNTLSKPVGFFWLKFAAIADILSIWLLYSMFESEVAYLEEHGAYCKLTAFGILNIICNVTFVLLLFVLSYRAKMMLASTNKEQTVMPEAEQEEKTEINQETEENVQ